MRQPPKNKRELLDRLDEIIRRGWYNMDVSRYSGSGAPGVFVEDLLGLTTGNKDIPDAVGWELKYYSPQTNLITLFHKEPNPKGVVRDMVSKYGWKDAQGRLSFRHTIKGKSDRFRVESDANRVIVRPIQWQNGPVPYWTDDDLLNAMGGKLRRLALIKGERKADKVRYTRVECFENPLLTELTYQLVRGTVAIDFDARENKPGSNAPRNHGTKFRVAPEDVCRLYLKKERIG